MTRRRGGADDVYDEPHMRFGAAPRCARCGYELTGLRAGVVQCPECGERFADDLGNPSSSGDAGESAWDEPAIRVGGADAPEGAQTWARWFEARRECTTPGMSWSVTLLVAIAAGPWAVIGAFLGASPLMSGILTAIVVGPVVEELMKVAAATYVVEKRPYLYRSSRQVLLCCGAGGLAFAVIENILYLFVYIPDPDAAIIIWRWTVCVCLHVGCSVIAGLGIARVWRGSTAERRPPELADAYPFLVTAIVVHGAYNALATLLEMSAFAF